MFFVSCSWRRNPHLVQITDTYIFTNPFTPKEATNHWSPLLDPYVRAVQGDPQLVDADHHMQQVFHNQKEALIHGDLHTGSAMVKEDDIKVTSVLDLECVCSCVCSCVCVCVCVCAVSYTHLTLPTSVYV